TKRRQERANAVEVLLGLGMVMERGQNARNALRCRRTREAREEADAFVCMPKRGGEDLVEAGEIGGRRRGGERRPRGAERLAAAGLDLRSERGGAPGRRQPRGALHREERVGGDGAPGGARPPV